MAQTVEQTIENLKREISQIQAKFESSEVTQDQAIQLIMEMKNIFVQLVQIEQQQDNEILNIENEINILQQFVGFPKEN